MTRDRDRDFTRDRDRDFARDRDRDLARDRDVAQDPTARNMKTAKKNPGNAQELSISSSDIVLVLRLTTRFFQEFFLHLLTIKIVSAVPPPLSGVEIFCTGFLGVSHSGSTQGQPYSFLTTSFEFLPMFLFLNSTQCNSP